MKLFQNILFKSLAVIILTAVIIFGVSSSYVAQSIDKLAYVVALAIDAESDSNIKLTIQLANPNNYSSQSSSSSSQSSDSTIVSVSCSSIESGINMLNSYISRNINLSHCKAIMISEEVSYNDLSRHVYDLCNNVEVSSHANIIITKCQANEYLKMSSPVLESFSARYYQIVQTSSKYTGYTSSISLIDFFNSMLDTFKQPIATLGNVNIDSSHINTSNVNTTNKDGAYVAGETPITSTNQVETMGVAVFKGGTLVGELNGLESICHMIISGELDYCTIQVPDPQNNSINIDLKLKLRGKPDIEVTFVNGFAYIKADIKLSARVLSVDTGNDYSDKNVVKNLENEINSYIEEIILDYLYKTAKEYNSDIDGFGKYAVKYFTTTKKWKDYNWLENYKNSFFEVNIDSKIKSGYSFISI